MEGVYCPGAVRTRQAPHSCAK